MKKNISISFVFFLFIYNFSFNIFCLTLHKKNFRHVASHMMHEQEQKARYWIALKEVYAYLPQEHDIKRKSVKLVNDRKVPGKTPLKVMKHFMYDKRDVAIFESAHQIFSQLAEDKPHTYVVTSERLIFTESTNNPSLEVAKDKFTKHFLISGLLKRVHYSGEFYVYKNKITNEVFVVFDNSSGTYQPPTELLGRLESLLDINFNYLNKNEEKIYIITKSYKQTINKNKLFAHSAEPFI